MTSLRHRRPEWFQDWDRNESGKSRFVMLAFRVAQSEYKRGGIRGKSFNALYQLATNWVLGVEIPLAVEIGPGLAVFHPTAIVVNPGTRIGANCLIRNNTTFGNKVERDGTPTAAPVIGDNCEFGANVCVIGPINIGSGARVGAGAVVIRDVPPGATAVGNPARLLQPTQPDRNTVVVTAAEVSR